MNNPDTSLSDRPALKARLEATLRAERRAVLLINSHARNGATSFQDAKRLLEERGLTVDPKFSALETNRLTELAIAAIEAGHRLIVVGGGDGTLSSVLPHFAYKDVVLGVLPLGTANSFARNLGIPVDLEGAIDIIMTGKVVDVDVGHIGEHYFSTVASVGLAANIARHMPGRVKKLFGRFAYPIVAISRLRHYRPFRCTITANGEETTTSALEVRIANGAYQGGVAVARGASAESRDLVLHVTTGHSIRNLLNVWFRLTVGARLHSKVFRTMRARRFVVDAKPRQYVCIDGEAFIHTPFEVRVAEQALLVVVPQDQQDLE
jgi:YegS/Rv2252/BmrU family lipid kinase